MDNLAQNIVKMATEIQHKSTLNIKGICRCMLVEMHSSIMHKQLAHHTLVATWHCELSDQSVPEVIKTYKWHKMHSTNPSHSPDSFTEFVFRHEDSLTLYRHKSDLSHYTELRAESSAFRRGSGLLHKEEFVPRPQGEQQSNISHNKAKWVYKLPQGKVAFLIGSHLMLSPVFHTRLTCNQ